MPSTLVRHFLISLFLFAGQLQAQDCFPKNPKSSFDIPERYAKIPTPLMDVLRKSYLQHSKDNRYLDNSFWGSNPEDKCSWPESMWEALDKMGPNGIYTMVNVYQKADKDFVWSTVNAIRNVWYGTSFGFTFDGADSSEADMIAYIKKNKSFCKDTEAVSKREHGGQICWRQILKDKKGSGLHICYGNGKKPEMHIDHNQVALGHMPFLDTCLYDPLALIKHYKDLKGKAPRTIFDMLYDEAEDLKRLKRDSDKSCEGFGKYLFQLNLDRMLERVTWEKLLELGSYGESGPSKGYKLFMQTQKEKIDLFNLSVCPCR